MDQNQKKWPTIKCPHCGYEYTISDIFMPDSFVGRPDSVVRDALGKILYLEYEGGNEPCQSEQYYCDGCDKPFIVEPVLTFKIKKEAEELDFSETYASLL